MSNTKKDLTIGTLAKSANVGVETIRFYERKGIITQPPKTGSFRVYPMADIKKVRFVKKMQELGFSLEEIKEFLSINEMGSSTNKAVETMSRKKMGEVKQKIEDLKSVLVALEDLSLSCGAQEDPSKSCNIIECFDNDLDCCKAD